METGNRSFERQGDAYAKQARGDSGSPDGHNLGSDNYLENEADSSMATPDDVIPNAIVIKNIPFAIKKEQLLDIIEDMDLPLPYAFNYHFDNGIFRGLAFANFTTADETYQVINNLNGKDINGRKLKVEYKKMLPQAERDRIEREKREKRGQLEEQHRSASNISLQSLGKAMSSSALNGSGSNSQLAAIFLNSNPSNNNNNNGSSGNFGLYNSSQNYSSSSLGQQQSSSQSQQQPLLTTQHTANSLYQQNYQQPPQVPSQILLQQSQVGAGANDRFLAPLPSSSTVPIPPQQLDFNDPETLEIYSQLLLFKDRERTYSELAYPNGLSANHKRIINVLCSYLNLTEVYDPRFMIIKRKVLDHSSLQKHLQQQGQLPVNGSNPLQPTSTGGSFSKSHSYTSLLQAHASAAAAAASNSGSNVTGNGTPGNVGLGNNYGSSKISHVTPVPLSSLSQSGVTGASILQQQNAPGNGSPRSVLNNAVLFNTDQVTPQSLANAQAQQQQQSFMRQQATLTPSSRIPSGYSSNHQSTFSTLNPLLRNAGASPTAATTQTNTASHRMLSAFHNSANANSPTISSASTYYDQQPQSQSQSQQQLAPQHTNGSIHSNFSIQSFHDDGVPLSSAQLMSTNELIYKSLSHTGTGNGSPAAAAGATSAPTAPVTATAGSGTTDTTNELENNLARSLSGLDLTKQPVQNNKKPVW